MIRLIALILIISIATPVMAEYQDPPLVVGVYYVGAGLLLNHYGSDWYHFGIDSLTGEYVCYKQVNPALMRWFGRIMAAAGVVLLIRASE